MIKNKLFIFALCVLTLFPFNVQAKNNVTWDKYLQSNVIFECNLQSEFYTHICERTSSDVKRPFLEVFNHLLVAGPVDYNMTYSGTYLPYSQVVVINDRMLFFDQRITNLSVCYSDDKFSFCQKDSKGRYVTLHHWTIMLDNESESSISPPGQSSVYYFNDITFLEDAWTNVDLYMNDEVIKESNWSINYLDPGSPPYPSPDVSSGTVDPTPSPTPEPTPNVNDTITDPTPPDLDFLGGITTGSDAPISDLLLMPI